jgi:chemotaxis protein CheX
LTPFLADAWYLSVPAWLAEEAIPVMLSSNKGFCMKAEFINPFLEAVTNVLKTMAFTEPIVGKPALKKKGEPSQGDITAIVGLTGAVKGSFALSFSEAAILEVVSNMFGEQVKEVNSDVQDAVGEISNMVSGDARRALADLGYSFQSSIPTVISGKGHNITPSIPGPSVVMPFTVGDGHTFFVEASFEDE